MDPITMSALKATLDIAKQIPGQLPKLAQSGRVSADIRRTAYGRFSQALWTLVENDSCVRSIQPTAGKPLAGLGYHGLFVRTLERGQPVRAEFLSAYGALRLIAPNAIVAAAGKVADAVVELMESTVGAADEHSKNQLPVGNAMIAFDLLSRIDLGVAKHPSAPRFRGYNIIAWTKWNLRARRGDWPNLPESMAGIAGMERMSSTQ